MQANDACESMSGFRLLNAASSVPRLGCLALAGKKPVQTPNYIPVTSRGALPHVTHDLMRDHMSAGALYAGLEDCKHIRKTLMLVVHVLSYVRLS